MVFDENQINHLLLSLYYNNQVFSMRDFLLKFIPKHYFNTRFIFKNLFMTTTLSYFLPEILEDRGHGKLIDFRCGFSKQFLSDKLDDEVTASQIWFKEGNQIDFNLGFGCGLFTYEGEYEPLKDAELIPD